MKAVKLNIKMTNAADKIKAIISGGTSMTLGSSCAVWEGNDGRVRVYWGGDSFAEIIGGSITMHGMPIKQAQRRRAAIEAALAE